MKHHLAEMNLGRMRAPIDDPIMQEFVEQIAYINALADQAAGFVWRLQSEEGDATAIRAFADPMMLVNMSVWESVESLYDFSYRSDHLAPVRDRRKWFERMDTPQLVMWWIPAGHTPTVKEGKERLELLTREGASARAFTFKQLYSASGEPMNRPDRADWSFA